MDLVEVRADLPVTQVEAVENALLEAGLERWSVVQDVITNRAWVVGIFESEPLALAGWTAMQGVLAEAGVTGLAVPAIRSLPETEWRDSYKSHFRPWTFGRLHWVPTWERGNYKVPPGDAVLWLDPGLAFGTGNHETTRLCVERLVTLAEEFGVRSSNQRDGKAETETSGTEPSRRRRSGPRVIDAGCGSGILALSAVLLGFTDVAGFDNDPEAVRVSQENAVQNNLAGRVDFYTADLAAGLAGRQAEIVLANIQANVLTEHARQLVDAVAPGGALVLSGILASENSRTREAFEELTPGWTVNARIMGEWSDIVLTRPRSGADSHVGAGN